MRIGRLSGSWAPCSRALTTSVWRHSDRGSSRGCHEGPRKPPWSALLKWSPCLSGMSSRRLRHLSSRTAQLAPSFFLGVPLWPACASTIPWTGRGWNDMKWYKRHWSAFHWSELDSALLQSITLSEMIDNEYESMEDGHSDDDDDDLINWMNRLNCMKR